MCLDLLNIPALPDDPASSYWHQRALEAWRKYKVPGSNNADAPCRTAALAGEWPAIDPADPQPGYYRVRLEPRGPFFPCMIFVTLGCLVRGLNENPHDWWLQAAKHPISRNEYADMIADSEAGVRHGL